MKTAFRGIKAELDNAEQKLTEAEKDVLSTELLNKLGESKVSSKILLIFITFGTLIIDFLAF